MRAGLLLAVVLLLAAQRPYWPVPIARMAAGDARHTHVRVSGVVAYVGHEGDQDMHIRLTDGTASIVAECVPRMPCLTDGVPWVPREGDTVTVYGISRWDPEHGWAEVHPVEAVRAGVAR